ncbi:ankyrin repeat protein [Sinorhizobium fredii]
MRFALLITTAVVCLTSVAPIYGDESSKTFEQLVTNAHRLENIEIDRLSEKTKADLLSYYANRDDAETVAKLLANGIKSDLLNSDGTTALFVAVGSEAIATISLLVRAGADANLETQRGTAKQLAERTGNPLVVATLDNRKPNPEEQLRFAARQGDIGTVERLLKSGTKIDETSEQGINALIEAAVAGNTEVARVLIASGADLDSSTADGLTPASIAIVSGNMELVALLLKGGANANGTSRGMPLLSVAAATGQEKAVDLLLSAGADPKIGDPNGLRPADIANSLGLDSLAKKLGGVSAPKQEYSLASAIQKNEAAHVHLALSSGENPNLKIGDVPALVFAAAYSTSGVVEELLKAGADLAAIGPEGSTALHAAFMNESKSEQFNIVIVLIKTALLKNNENSTLRFLSARNRNGRSALVLLCANTGGNLWKDEKSYRHFFFSAFESNEVRKLINMPDDDGTTPFEAAVISGNVFLARLFAIWNRSEDQSGGFQEIARARKDWAMLAALPSDRSLPAGLSKSADIETMKELQTRLKQWGYYDGEIDGVFGAGSRAALKSFFEDRAIELKGMALSRAMGSYTFDDAKDGEMSFTLDFDHDGDACIWRIREWSKSNTGATSRFVGCVDEKADHWNGNGIALVEYRNGEHWAIELFGPGGWDDRSDL